MHYQEYPETYQRPKLVEEIIRSQGNCFTSKQTTQLEYIKGV